MGQPDGMAQTGTSLKERGDLSNIIIESEEENKNFHG